MIYNKTSIDKKRKQLRSKKNRVHSSAGMIVVKLLLLLFLIALAGGSGLLYGSFKGILASTPINYSLKPKYSATIIYDDEEKEVQF